jgi:hydroxyacylglutathione hydrolase
MSATAGSGVEVVAIDTPALGDRSYLAHDGDIAVVVAPQRDTDQVLALAAARGCGSPTCSRPICTTTT